MNNGSLPPCVPMKCRTGCGACCIAPSISSSFLGMPNGKPAGVVCVHLTTDYRCKLYGKPERPKVCSDFMASGESCGSTRDQALSILSELERLTAN